MRGGRLPAKRAINLLHLAPGEGLAQPFVDLVGLGDEHQAARVLVEPVHDAEPLLPASSGQLCTAMMNQRINERSRPMPNCGMDDQPRLFVDRDQRVVLVDNIDGNGFAGWLSLDGAIGLGSTVTESPALSR